LLNLRSLYLRLSKMIKVLVYGISEGKHQFDIVAPSSEIENLFPEYSGDVSVSGSFTYNSDRYRFKLIARATAKLTCDISLELYEEEFQAEIKFILKDMGSYFVDIDDDIIGKLNVVKREIDISRYVAEALSLEIPMKKVSPKYRGKDLKEIYPKYADDNEIEDKMTENEQNSTNEKESKSDKIDPRWSSLKNIKLN